MTIQNNEEIQMLKRLLEKEQRELEEARKKEAYWNNVLQKSLKSVEYLTFLIQLREEHLKPEAKEIPVLGRFEGRTIKESAFEILRSASRPLSVNEVRERLNAGGKKVDSHIVSTILSQEVKKGSLKRIAKGVFALLNGQEEKSEEK